MSEGHVIKVNESVSFIRKVRQEIAVRWATQCFGPDHVNSVEQRAIRFLEEAVELYQACGCDREMAIKMVNFVFDRPVGTVENEFGGVGLTILLLANAAGLDADTAERKELDRVLGKSRAEFTKRNEAKNAAGFVAGAYPTTGREPSKDISTGKRQIGKSPLLADPYGAPGADQ